MSRTCIAKLSVLGIAILSFASTAHAGKIPDCGARGPSKSTGDLDHFRDAKIELDSGRLEQEMVLFSQKIDVSEELERIDTHISEVRRILKHGGVVGRRLDFLMQELNREANTLGAKSTDVDTTRASVELKVLIEQVREQVQNIE